MHTFTLSSRAVCVATFYVVLLGVLAAAILLAGAIVATFYLLQLALITICDISSHIATLYTHTGPETQLVLLALLGLFLYKLIGLVARMVSGRAAVAGR